ncbi:hypothetical protein SAY86_000240 [Trapa natans]|uniref:Uncharacterized protein n=1 Tax=Trapa natans TaxID=22666 RepID=A0AAN7RFJ3_TRANT|nr:hypothetical protein SAY86_000240 [Trapa natans]
MWHLFNHIRLHARSPSSYSSPTLFPTQGIRHLELFLIMSASTVSGPAAHSSGSIPSNHLHNFEHSLISISFFTYAVVALIFDRAAAPPAVLDPRKARSRVVLGLTQLVTAVAFSLQLLLFHLYSTDHMGLEGQYHLLLQVVIIVSLATTLIRIGHPRSFLVAFLRSPRDMVDGYGGHAVDPWTYTKGLLLERRGWPLRSALPRR